DHAHDEQQRRHVGLSFLERAPAQSDIEQDRGKQRDQRQQHQEEAAKLGRAEKKRHADRRQRREVERQIKAGERQRDNERIEYRHRGPFADNQLQRRERHRQQGLQRRALALARRRIERRGHAAHQRRKQAVVRDQEKNQRSRLLRRGQVDILDVERPPDVGRDASQREPLRSPHSIVGAQQR